jgi:protein-S-isoprenylcysteine O-methyltransferase Ste14
VLGGLIVALGSIYALTVSYNIPGAELLWFLVGSVLVLLAAMLAALLLLLLVKGLRLTWRRIWSGASQSADKADKDRDVSDQQ